jgi:hypothetical protein
MAPCGHDNHPSSSIKGDRLPAQRLLACNKGPLTVISDFRRDVDKICALHGYYAASNGNPLLTFRGNVSVPSSRVKMSW